MLIYATVEIQTFADRKLRDTIMMPYLCIVIIIITAVISVAPYLTNKEEHTALYNKTVHIKPFELEL